MMIHLAGMYEVRCYSVHCAASLSPMTWNHSNQNMTENNKDYRRPQTPFFNANLPNKFWQAPCEQPES